MQGQVFLGVIRDFQKRGYTMMKIQDFKSWVRDVGGKVPDNVIVFEKEVAWVEQSLWCSSLWLVEEVRVALLTKGIDVVDDESAKDGMVLMMKDMSK